MSESVRLEYGASDTISCHLTHLERHVPISYVEMRTDVSEIRDTVSIMYRKVGESQAREEGVRYGSYLFTLS